MIIAIDGPAGSGKSTVARMLAKRLNFQYIETGSMYRAVAWKSREMNIDPGDLQKIADVAKNIVIEFLPGEDGQRLIVDGEDLTGKLKNEEIGRIAALVAANPKVRDVLVAKQREMGSQGNAVMDGRDIGTVVFPQAEKKFFMVADVAERARRRYDEMKSKEPEIKLEAVVEQVQKRDYEDENRKVSPLRPAEDSVLLDTTQLDIEQVIEEMMRVIQPAHNV